VTGVELLRESRAMHVRTLPANDPKIAAIDNGLAEALLQAAKYREAEKLLNEAVAILERVGRRRSGNWPSR